MNQCAADGKLPLPLLLGWMAKEAFNGKDRLGMKESLVRVLSELAWLIDVQLAGPSPPGQVELRDLPSLCASSTRRRRIPLKKKKEISRVAARSMKLRHTETLVEAQKVLGLDAASKPSTARFFTDSLLVAYREATIRQLSGPNQSLSISLDGARIGGEETVNVAVWGATSKKAAWLPCQVGKKVWNELW